MTPKGQIKMTRMGSYYISFFLICSRLQEKLVPLNHRKTSVEKKVAIVIRQKIENFNFSNIKTA
jgi:hypothetical protein